MKIVSRIFLFTLFVCMFARVGIGELYLNLGFVKLISGMTTGSVKAIERAGCLFNAAGHYAGLYRDAQRAEGFVLFLQQDTSGAIKAWEHARPESIYTLALWLHEQKEFSIAIDLLEGALDSYPASACRLDWWHGLVEGCSAQKQWDKVIEVAQYALVEYPGDAELLFVLGRTLYTHHQDVEGAEQLIKQAIAEDEDFAEAYAWMGHMMAAENHPDEAYDWYRKANEIEPSRNWRLLQANMARSTDLPLAFVLYDKIIEDYPDYGDAYYELSWAYLLADDIDGAVDVIEQALRYAPTNGRYYSRAAKIIERIGDPTKVMRVCQEVAEINPDNPLMKNKVCQ